MYTTYNEKIPKDAIEIINTIEKAGFEAYIVGGCVRDLLMGREPHDWDITTSAKPEEVKGIFRRTYDTGIEHGTVTVILHEEHFEVTTYRIEGEYKDFRRPEEVSFVEDITLDLSRRDFTMNAIAYHPERGFVDPYEGQKDIDRRCIRSVRNAAERFHEDALRILRALRFSAQLGFEIEEDTIKGIKECRALLAYISKERIRDEFIKMCLSPRPQIINELYKLDLLEYIVPQFEAAYSVPQNHPHHVYNVAEHTIVAMQNAKPEQLVRLSVFLHDIGKVYTHTTDQKGIDHFYGHPKKSMEISKTVLRDLKLDNQTIKEVGLLVEYHDYHLKQVITPVLIKKVLMKLGPDLFDKLMLVQEADAKGQNLEKLMPKLESIKYQKQLKAEILERGEAYNKAMLKINGQDLIEAGVPKGKEIGELLDLALEKVIEEPAANEKETLLMYCMSRHNQNK